jgi:uncharacterized protein (TIGR03083 family)
MDASAWLSHLRADGERFGAAAHHDLDAPVTACPGWVLADLIEHLGTVHVWVRQCLSSDPDGRPPRWDSLPPAPGRTALASWYVDVHGQMTDALAADDLDRPVTTFMGKQTVAWWIRRQAHETAVHRWDAQAANGTPMPIDTDLAIDGVDELLDMVVPRFGAKIGGNGETIHLHAIDDDTGAGEWLLTLGSDGTTVTKGHQKGDAAVRATASDLILLLWGRRAVDDLEVHGDAELVEGWRARIGF